MPCTAASYSGQRRVGDVADVEDVPHAGGGIVRPRFDGSGVARQQLAICGVDDVWRLRGEMQQVVGGSLA